MRGLAARAPERLGRRLVRERAGGEHGSALVEIVWLSLILLIPMVYVLMCIVSVQRTAYGVTEAARDAGRAYVLSRDPATARHRAIVAAQVAMRDQGVALPPSGVTIVCRPTPQSCLRPGSSVAVWVHCRAPLPGLPPIFGHHPGSILVSARHVEPVSSYRQARS